MLPSYTITLPHTRGESGWGSSKSMVGTPHLPYSVFGSHGMALALFKMILIPPPRGQWAWNNPVELMPKFKPFRIANAITAVIL